MHFFRKSKPKEKKAWGIEEVHENLEYNSSDESNDDGDNNNDGGGNRKGKKDRIPMLSIQSNTNNDNDNDNDYAPTHHNHYYSYATTHHHHNQNGIINSPVNKKQQKKKKKKKKKWTQTMPLENKVEKAQEKAQKEEERSIIQYPGFMKLQYKSGRGQQLVGGKRPLMKTKTYPSTTTHREASELTFIRSNRTHDNESSMDDTSMSRLSLSSSTTTTTEAEAETATLAVTRTPSVPAWTYATRQDYEAHLSDNVNIASLSYWTGGFLGESNNNSNGKIKNNDKNSVTMPANDNVIDVGSSSSSSASSKTKTKTRSSNITNTNVDISTTAEGSSATNDEPVSMTFTPPFFDRTSSSSLRSIPEEDNEDNEEEEDDENQDVKALQEKLYALHHKIAVATKAAKQRVKEKQKNNTIELVLVESEVQGGPLSTNCYGPHFLGNTSLGRAQQQQQQQQSPSPLPTAAAILHKLKFVSTAKKEEKSDTPHKSDVTATTIVSCSSTTTSPRPPSISSMGAPSNSLITCTSQEFYSSQEENGGGGSSILDSVAALKSVLSNNNVSAAEENQNNNTVGVVTSRNNTTTDHRYSSSIIQPAGVVDAVATTTSLLDSIDHLSKFMCAHCTPISPEKKKQYGDDNNDIEEEEEDRDDVDDENGGESSSIVNTFSETRYSSREEVGLVEGHHDNYDVRIIAEVSTLEDQYYDNEDDRDDAVADNDNNYHRRNSAEMEGNEAVNQPIVVGSSSTSTSTSTSSSSSSLPDATTPEQQQIRSLQKTIEELKASLPPKTTRSSPNEEASSSSSPTPPVPPPPPPPPVRVVPPLPPLLQPLLVRNHDTRNEAAWKRCAPRSQCDQKTKAVIQFPIPKKILSPNDETDEKKGVKNSNEKKKVNHNSKEGSSRSSLWYTNFFERFPSLDGMSKTKNAVVATTTTTTTTGEILESSE